MHPILFQIGPITLYTYGLFVAIGFSAALYFGLKNYQKTTLFTKEDDVYSLSLWLIIVGFVGARIFYVIQYWEYFSADWARVFFIQDRSGFVWYGGVIACLIFQWIYTRRKNISFIKLVDFLSPAIVLGQAFGRIGCFMYGCCYGVVTQSFLGVYFPHSPLQARHPTQLYESLFNFIFFLFLWKLFEKRKFDGQVFGVTLMGHAIFRFLVEFLRVNPAYLFNLTAAQWVGIVLLVVGGVVLYKGSKNSNVPDESEN